MIDLKSLKKLKKFDIAKIRTHYVQQVNPKNRPKLFWSDLKQQDQIFLN